MFSSSIVKDENPLRYLLFISVRIYRGHISVALLAGSATISQESSVATVNCLRKARIKDYKKFLKSFRLTFPFLSEFFD